ncbi:MAG: FecR family protein [Siphonobacter sp.]
MMNQYTNYSLEDFVLDIRFQRWVRYQEAEVHVFWQDYIHQNPHQKEDILQARFLLEGVYDMYKNQISDSEIHFEIQKLITQANLSKQPVIATPSPGSTKVINIPSPLNRFFVRVAVVVSLLTLGWVLWNSQRTNGMYDQRVAGQALIEKRNQTHANQTLLLSDGSRVVLYPHSRISYPPHFTSDKRQIYLSGTAFFEVTKDPKRPFYVYANELVTKVLGTSFIIKAPTDANKTTVEVKEGKVSVIKEITGSPFNQTKENLHLNTLIVTTNQKVIFEPDQDRMVKTLRDNPEIIPSAERCPTFQFKDTPVSEVLAQINLAYQVNIVYDKEVLLKCPLTATLTDQSLYEKLTVICEAIGARYEVLDGQIIVNSKGCN